MPNGWIFKGRRGGCPFYIYLEDEDAGGIELSGVISFCETMIELAQRDIFDTFAFNELGATGRGAVEDIDKNPLHRETVVLICKTFDTIGEAAEKSQRVEIEKAYLEIFKQVQSLKKWMESKGKHDKTVEDEIEAVLGKFKELEAYEGKTIKWPTLPANTPPEKPER